MPVSKLTLPTILACTGYSGGFSGDASAVVYRDDPGAQHQPTHAFHSGGVVITRLTGNQLWARILFMFPTGEAGLLQAWVRLRAWLGRGTGRWWFLAVFVMAVVTFGVRCLRLADPTHYYVYSPDSYYFHWLAARVTAGQGPPLDSTPEGLAIYTLHSGLSYPLAYIAKALSYVFNLSSAESLALAARFLPPTLAVVIMIVIYIGASRIWGRGVALFSALAWALMFLPVFVTAGGYIDRDGLSVLLLLTGALIFYFFKGYHAKIGRIEVGWLCAGVGVLAVEGLLYLEWGLPGAAVLVAVLVIYAVMKYLVNYLGLLQTQPNAMVRMSTALKKLEWPVLGLIVCVNIVAVGVYHQGFTFWVKDLWYILQTRSAGTAGTPEAAEMTGLSFSDILAFQFFLIPIALGLYSAWKSRNEASLFFSSWFVGFAILSLISWRFILYAIPAACVIAALGLYYLWQWRSRASFPIVRSLGVGILLVLLLALALTGAASLNAASGLTADENWQEALTYLRENTPTDAVVMSQWSPGYWILDLGQRKPFVDNGYYGHDADRLRDVALAYLATDPSEAAKIMAERGTDYLVFSKDDLDVAGAIMGWAGLKGYDSFPGDSLVVRSLNGDFVSGSGLDVVYHNEQVVILGLTGHETS
jgi:asparagine N-glycosylation enzyme membrane subunit Stt3